MKAFALVAIILLAASVAFADTVSQEYTAGDWLKVSRTIENAGEPLCLDSMGITDACAAGGSIQPNQGYSGSSKATVTLTAENTGVVERRGVDITEDISYVPTGAKITFDPAPTTSTGRTVTWSIDSLGTGGSRTFTYTISAKLSPLSLSALPDIGVSAEPTTLSLSAPDSVSAGDKASVSVQSANGKPIPNAIVIVTYPDGIKHPVRTDSTGTVKFTAKDEGTYTYSIEGYSMANQVSTEAAPTQAVPTSPVAATQDSGLAASIMGVLPILAALFAIAVIGLILYNFITSRRADEDDYVPETHLAGQAGASTSTPESGMTYTQKFSFGSGEAPEDKAMRDQTANIIDSRKRRLASTAAPVQEEETEGASTQEDPEESEPYDSSATTEKTATDEDMASILSELEHKARVTGEVAEEQEEVERTIAELESIREKLRAMRAQGKGANSESEEPEENEASAEDESPAEEISAAEPSEEAADDLSESKDAEEETFEEEEPVQRKTPKKVIYEKRAEPKVKPVAKGKKQRFGNRGVKKK